MTESKTLKKTISLITSYLVLTVSTAYAADTPAGFLEKLNGEFRGRGEALIEISNSQERVSCKLDNNLNKEANILDITGVCATTQGKAQVDGKLQVKDGKVVGSFISPFKDSEITQSSSNYDGKKLVLSTSFVNKSTGNLSRMRQIVESNSKGGFNSTFQKYDNASKAYKNTGFVSFSRVGQ